MGCVYLLVCRTGRPSGDSSMGNTSELPAAGGHLVFFQWARSQGLPWNVKTFKYAAYAGHLEVLQWARSHGCEWDERTCAFAARGGHLVDLQWALNNGCPWSERFSEEAVSKGHLHILQWIGYPWNSSRMLASPPHCAVAPRECKADLIIFTYGCVTWNYRSCYWSLVLTMTALGVYFLCAATLYIYDSRNCRQTCFLGFRTVIYCITLFSIIITIIIVIICID
jgi:hypothetical protein